MPDDLQPLLQQLSALSTTVIASAFAIHVFVFVLLWFWSKRNLNAIASSLSDFTRGLRHQSVLGTNAHLSDQVDAFLADVNDVLDDPAHADDRLALKKRISILDERRGYLGSMLFDTAYNIAHTMIEAYPLAGVLGTILAIGSALQSKGDAAASETVSAIVGRFGDAIWSTFAGLVAAIILMFINSILEPPFTRLVENRRHVRETVARAKRELSMMSPTGGAAE